MIEDFTEMLMCQLDEEVELLIEEYEEMGLGSIEVSLVLIVTAVNKLLENAPDEEFGLKVIQELIEIGIQEHKKRNNKE